LQFIELGRKSKTGMAFLRIFPDWEELQRSALV